MSQINYDIYGTPDQWRCIGTTPTTGSNGTLYGEQRIGASDWTNADFTDYPPFRIGLYGAYKSYYINGLIGINSPIDNTIAYTAMANPELPQQNVVVLDYIHNSLSNPVAKTINSNPSPFALGWYYKSGSGEAPPSWNGQLYGFDGFPNNASVFGSQGMQRVLPYASIEGNDIWNTSWGEYNPNYRLMPCVQFGVKSVILEIQVKYLTNATEVASATLDGYLNHTSQWLHDHPVIGAWCKPYFRTTTTGRYSTSESSLSQNYAYTGIQPIFFRPYNLQGVDIYNLMGYIIRDGNLSGNFPIFGLAGADGGTSQLYVDSSAASNPDQTHMSSYACLYGANRGELVTIQGSTSARFCLKLDLSISDNVEFIRRGAAAYGLFFCDDIGSLGDAGRDSGLSERWLDEDMYCGIIRSDGMTYGEYSKGLYNAEREQYDWTDSTQTPFVPSQDINTYSNQTRIRSIGHIDTMCDRYVLDATAVNQLAVDMYTIMSDLSLQQTDWSDLLAKALDNFLVQNPIDCIVSLKKYPVREIPNEGSLIHIHYGRYTSGTADGKVCSADVYTYAFTPKRIQSRFGNSFLDYEPFTSAELYIPYCGSISLKMCDILDKQLEPFLCVDYHTGQCTGFVMANGIVIETIQGTIGIDVPITGIQTATIEAQLMQSANNARSVRLNQAFSGVEGLGKIALGAKFGGVLGGATAFANAAKTSTMLEMQKYQADYDLTHTAAPQHIIGSSSSACGWIIDSDTARLILYYPTGGVIDDANPPNFITPNVNEFGSIYGFATIESGTLGSYPGFTTATEMILDNITTEHGAPATEPELEMIRSAISEGVIIPNIQ